MTESLWMEKSDRFCLRWIKVMSAMCIIGGLMENSASATTIWCAAAVLIFLLRRNLVEATWVLEHIVSCTLYGHDPRRVYGAKGWYQRSLVEMLYYGFTCAQGEAPWNANRNNVTFTKDLSQYRWRGKVFVALMVASLPLGVFAAYLEGGMNLLREIATFTEDWATIIVPTLALISIIPYLAYRSARKQLKSFAEQLQESEEELKQTRAQLDESRGQLLRTQHWAGEREKGIQLETKKAQDQTNEVAQDWQEMIRGLEDDLFEAKNDRNIQRGVRERLTVWLLKNLPADDPSRRYLERRAPVESPKIET
ncbi:MAG: hypothetical protein V1821_00175, partial [bacterium]